MHFGKYLVRRERIAGGTVDAHLARVQYRGRLGADQTGNVIPHPAFKEGDGFAFHRCATQESPG